MALLDNGTIIVTGGAGLIGSALVWALNRRGLENILIVDQLGTDEKFKNLVPLRYKDYLEADQFAEYFRSPANPFGKTAAVFHLGACSATTERDASYLIRNNYQYTRDLCSWALHHGIRFSTASSASTYGHGAQGMEDNPDNLESLRPQHMYGYSKHLFDLHAKRHGLLGKIVSLKYFNVFGPNENHKGDMRSVVHKAYHQILADGRVQLFKSDRPDYEDGCQMRDFLYVKDAVAATIFLTETPEANGIFNVGSGVPSTWLDLVGAIFQSMGREPVIEFVPLPVHLRGKYQYFTCADIGRLRRAGYREPFRPLAEAVRDYVQGYLMSGRHLGDE